MIYHLPSPHQKKKNNGLYFNKCITSCFVTFFEHTFFIVIRNRFLSSLKTIKNRLKGTLVIRATNQCLF